jgi:phage shock protein A
MRTIDKEMAAKLRVEGNNVIVASSERLVNMALRQLEEMEDRLGEMKLALEQARHAEELMRGDLRRLTQRVGHLEDFIRLNDLEVPHHANGSRG